MDNTLFSFINETAVPKLNPILANGIVVEHMKQVEGYVDKIFRSASEGFPEGLVYHRMEHCTPNEEYAETVKKKNNKRTYETARSDVYMVKLIFSWRKEVIVRFMYLPYVRDGGLIYILGALYSISAVLNDTPISVGLNDIFIPLTCAKNTYERTIHHYYINNDLASEFVIWSNFYLKDVEMMKSRGRPTIKANSCLAHYLFAKYGVKETFNRFGHTDIVVGTTDTINSETYPEDKWCVCYSTKPALKGTGSNLALAIKRDEWSPLLAGLVGGFFYVVDLFPDRVLPEYLDGTDDELSLWRILLGHVIFATDVSEGKLLVDINIHIEYFDGYIDASARDDLAGAGIIVDNIYQLLAHIIETFPERIMAASNTIGSMYGKRLSVLRYVCLPITKEVFKFMFRLRKMTGKPVTTAMDISNIMNKFLKPDLIMSINRDHGEVKPIASSSDNKAMNITNAIVLQAQSNGIGGAKAKSSLYDPGRQLHASIAEAGSLTHLPKSEPSGRSRANLCAHISPDGMILRDPAKQALIDSVQEKIKR